MTVRAYPTNPGAQMLAWILTGTIAFALGLTAGSAKAAEAGDLVIRAGAAGVYFDSSGDMAVGGTPVPTAKITLDPIIYQAGLSYRF